MDQELLVEVEMSLKSSITVTGSRKLLICDHCGKEYEQIKKRKRDGGHYIPQVVLNEYEEKFEEPTEKEGFELIEV